MKLNYNDLRTPIFSTSLGGSADDAIQAVVADWNTGEVIVVGETESTDFPTTPGAFQQCLGGNGGYHAEPTLIGGGPGAWTSLYPLDSFSQPFPCHFSPTPGVGKPDSLAKPNVDGFVTKFGPTGALIFSSYLGGSLDDDLGATLDDKAGNWGESVALDNQSNIYVTGWTESTSTPIAMCGPAMDQPCPYNQPFPTTPGAYITNLPQDPIAACGPNAPEDCIPPNKRLHANALVTKLNPTGTALSYSTYLGGYGDDAGFGITVDSAGQAYVTGIAESTNFPGTADSGTLTAVFPNVHPLGKYLAHPACPNCGAYLNGIMPP
jgi:hypothetical protein